MQVKILGSGSATPSPGRNHSAQVLMAGNEYHLIDCGEGTQHRMMEMSVRMFRIDHIYISHLHGDHCLGLVGLLSSFHNLGRTEKMTVNGPIGLRDLLIVHFRCSDTRLNYLLEVKEINTENLLKIADTRNLEVYTFPLRHRIPTFGYLFREKPKLRNLIKQKIQADMPLAALAKLKQGIDVLTENGDIQYKVEDFTHPLPHVSSYAYCSDTVYHEELIDFISGVQLLYHESTFLDDKVKRAEETFHSTATQAARIAKKAKVKKLMIGHFSSRYNDLQPFLEQAKEVFENTLLAEEGIVVEV